MDSKMGKSGNIILCSVLCAVCSVSAFAQETNKDLYHVAYSEKVGDQTRSLEARVQGKEIFIDKRVGSFPQGLPDILPLAEAFILPIENFPAISVQRKFKTVEEKIILEKKLIRHSMTLELKAAEELIPLTDEESQMNELLRPFGIEKIDLQGEGELWFDPAQKKIVTEQFLLQGEVVRNGRSEPWVIEYVAGAERL